MKKKSFLLSALAVLGVAMAFCTPEQQPEKQGDGTPSAGTVIEKLLKRSPQIFNLRTQMSLSRS